MGINSHTVYMHVSPNGKRYIGITERNPISRWNEGKNYNTNHYFTNAIMKYGWDNFEHLILFSGLSRDEARTKEIELIEKYNTINPEYGYNLTLGGGGCKGYKQTDEAKKRISAAMSAREVSNETRIKTAESVSKLHDREFYVNIRKLRGEVPSGKDAYRYGVCGNLHVRSMPVLQLDINTGDIIAIHESLTLAAIAVNGNKHKSGRISAVCKGKRKSAMGYGWKYAG